MYLEILEDSEDMIEINKKKTIKTTKTKHPQQYCHSPNLLRPLEMYYKSVLNFILHLRI